MFGDESEARLTPDDLTRLEQALERACAEATLTGAAGRKVIYGRLLARFRRGASDEELRRQAKMIIARRRGLPGVSDAGEPSRRSAARRGGSPNESAT